MKRFFQFIKQKISKEIFFAVICSSIFTILFVVAFLSFAFHLTPQKIFNTAQFLGVMRFIENNHVKEVDEKKLFDGALSGMFKSLDDPYSSFLDEKTFTQLKEYTQGTFGGVGLVMSFENHQVKVMSILKDTPAEKAGLKIGDLITEVDGTPTNKMETEQIVLAIRGKPKTSVVLKIDRAGETSKEYTIMRDNIHVQTADGVMLEKNLGYIRISSFADQTGKEFLQALEKLQKENLKGLIVDLRDNPGGNMTTCLEIAEALVPKGSIVSLVYRDGRREEFQSKLEKIPCPLVVLINHNSASASEILAGALQDRQAATIVGMTSYKKASVQILVPMPNQEQAFKLTVAKYFTPNGRSIHETGITPDVEIDLPKNATKDVQLEKARQVLEEKINEEANKNAAEKNHQSAK